MASFLDLIFRVLWGVVRLTADQYLSQPLHAGDSLKN